VSEKLDGIRAMWDGRGNLVSRNGLVFKAPPDFVRSLPKGMYLDGELWIDLQMFSDVVSIVRSRPDNWTMVKFKVFDGFSSRWKFYNFHDRINACRTIINACDPHVSIVDHVPLIDGSICEITNHLSHVISKKGEGIILRDPTALYSPGRKSPSLSPILKVKATLDDEAIVIENNFRPSSRKGSLVVRDRGGRVFKIGSGLGESMTQTISVGSLITFAYNSRNESSGIPRFPRFVRLREDVDFNPQSFHSPEAVH
jgi:DNA ligase-1